MIRQDEIESIKMGLDLIPQQQAPGSRYDILIVLRDEIQRLLDRTVREMRIDNED